MTDSNMRSLSQLDQSDTLDPQEAEMAARPQPDESDFYVRDVNETWAREHRENAARALSRRRVPLWVKLAAVTVAWFVACILTAVWWA